MSATAVPSPIQRQTQATGADGHRSTSRSDLRPVPARERSHRVPLPHYIAGSDDAEVSSAFIAPSDMTAPAEARRGRGVQPPAPSTMGPQSPAPRARRSAQQYLALARPTLVKRVLACLDGLAAHAQTPSAGLYVFQIDRLATDALERFFDDGFLDLLLAVRNGLAINNAWMRYTSEQIQSIQETIRRYAHFPADNGRAFRRGILALNQLGIDTTPFDLPAELLFDAEE